MPSETVRSLRARRARDCGQRIRHFPAHLDRISPRAREVMRARRVDDAGTSGNVFLIARDRECATRASTSACGRRQKGAVEIAPSRDDDDAGARLRRWAESDAVRRVAGRYCPFAPPPRSTIAVAYAPDGKTVASTHGDHTVKLTECATGRTMASLEGHRRTPWVVRFHPSNANVLASGSLDNTVIVWDARSGSMTARWDFGKSIASLAFCPRSDVLCVAAGHKLYAWKYTKYRTRSDASGAEVDVRDAVSVLLKTTRSLRAVHFHPCGAPLMLTAEVREMDVDALEPAYTRCVGGNDALGNTNYDQEAGVYVASREEGEDAVGTSRERRRECLNAPAEEMWRCREHVPTDIENASGEVKSRVRDMLGLSNRRYMTYSMSQMMSRISRAPVRAAYEERVQMELGGSDARPRHPASGSGDASEQDVPCIVKLKLWEFETRSDGDGEAEIMPLKQLQLVLPQTVLCSEMGAHFSPCGRYIATCQACKPESSRQDVQYVCELRTYSIDAHRFGQVLSARAIKAAHCLTSIQFSPTSSHVLLAYGRRHPSLLLLMADAESFSQVHTILEIFDAKSMRLVRVIPSVEDEVNAACFHPIPGQGIAYGTKEGRLRVLLHDNSPRRAEKRLTINNAQDDSPLTVAMHAEREVHYVDVDG